MRAICLKGCKYFILNTFGPKLKASIALNLFKTAQMKCVVLKGFKRLHKDNILAVLLHLEGLEILVLGVESVLFYCIQSFLD